MLKTSGIIKSLCQKNRSSQQRNRKHKEESNLNIELKKSITKIKSPVDGFSGRIGDKRKNL